MLVRSFQAVYQVQLIACDAVHRCQRIGPPKVKICIVCHYKIMLAHGGMKSVRVFCARVFFSPCDKTKLLVVFVRFFSTFHVFFNSLDFLTPFFKCKNEPHEARKKQGERAW